MLLVASASTAFLGKIERMKSVAFSSLTSPTAAAALATSGIGAPTPGWKKFTSTRPRPIETRLAVMNHVNARMPMRPNAALSPMCAMPTTMVDSTSGATSILMRFRKMSLISLNHGAMSDLIRSAGSD